MGAALFNFEQPYNWKNLGVLVLCAFLLRAAVFHFYIQHNERYRQADSNDYHSCAVAMAYNLGMSRTDNHQPIFWRTPGYPAYLKPFYAHYRNRDPRFSAYMLAQ